MKLALAIVLVTTTVAATAGATPAEPKGAHPRMILDGGLRSAWKQQAGLEHGPVVGSIKLCAHARETHEHDSGVYRGSEWVKVLQACLVAWGATDSKDDAATAIKFATALLEDQDMIGDHKGGDSIVTHDDGYPIRMVAWTAIAYDWLYDQWPAELRARARGHWKAWLAWYRDKGYRKDTPGTNYHAGYLFAATVIAIAQGGEAGADGAKLWTEVADKMWAKDMAVAFTDDGALAGGEWPEGWQYGPLSVAEIAFAARAMRQNGAPVQTARWLRQLLRVHVYGLTPGDGVFVLGDSEDETAAYVKPSPLTLDAIALGDASPDDKRWARGELSRLQLQDVDWLVFDAIAGVGDKPELPPRASWPTWYVATAVRTLFARTSWNPDAVWFVAECAPWLDVDHHVPNAGDFALSRGKDDVIVDPSPYGSQSTLTTNAPTIRNPKFPQEYQPSQGYWSEKTGWNMLTQRASGIVAGRCDYADQFKFQDAPSSVPEAVRDLVLIPSTDRKDAALVVIDHADTGGADREMHLQFHSTGKLVLTGSKGDGATATVGGTKLVITNLLHAGKPVIGTPSGKDCFKEGTVRGTCTAARIPSTAYRLELPGPTPRAVHIIAATDPKTSVTSTALSGPDWGGVALAGMRDAAIIWRTKGTGAFTYTAPHGVHVVLDAPDKASVTAKPEGAGCAVAITTAKGGAALAPPLVIALDDQCKITPDPEAATGVPVAPTLTKPTTHPRTSRRGGCCGTQSGPASPIATGALVLGLFMWPRRRKILKKS
ncbi:MAG: hypothetical protein ABJE66_01490 [Deltaproteobacteria bacterium]